MTSTFFTETIESLEQELREKRNETFSSQYHELKPILDEIYLLRLEQERSRKAKTNITDCQRVALQANS